MMSKGNKPEGIRLLSCEKGVNHRFCPNHQEVVGAGARVQWKAYSRARITELR